ncbi:hypothetical protein DPMN_148346 [Dreissena polymorpha]|uniref:Uncharacterized protein n=1 Tax=Dreissena polymorpha TaxID=45954 RepID=A0A9D4FFC8_DREPO|nr:hypothetical protein DPMN_148346 [Dreissena polymorpha]
MIWDMGLHLNNRLSGQLGPDAKLHFLTQDLGANAQLVLPAGRSHTEPGAQYFLGQGPR